MSGNQRTWSFTRVAFAVLYASQVSIMYIVQLFAYLPKAQRGTLSESGTVLLADTFGTSLQAIDGLGYLFLGLATLAAAPVFTEISYSICSVVLYSHPFRMGHTPLRVVRAVWPAAIVTSRPYCNICTHTRCLVMSNIVTDALTKDSPKYIKNWVFQRSC